MGSVEIVGAGVAGFSLARHLVQQGYNGQITLNDPQGLPYDRPPLSKSLERVPFAPLSWFEQHGISIEERQIEDSQLPEDPNHWIVLATGSIPVQLECPGAERAEVIHTAATAEALSQKLSFGAFGTSVVVIGAGLVGAEFASAARQFGAMVTMISNRENPGSQVFGHRLATQLHEQHRLGGIRVITGEVQRITGDSVWVQDEEIEADIVVSAIGVQPNTVLAQKLGIEVDNGILVDQQQRTNQPQVLAIGDAARVRGQRAYQHWDRAIEDAAIAAATITGAQPLVRNTPWFWSDRHETHIEVAGDFAAATQTVERMNWQDQIQSSFGLDEGGRLVAAASTDGGTTVETMRKLIAEGSTPPIDALKDPRISARELGENR